MKKILSLLLSMFFVMGALAGCTPNADVEGGSGSSNSSDVGAPDDIEKNYEITLNANGGSVSQTKITVTYGEAYTLPTPTHSDDCPFKGWTYNGETIELSGVWNLEVEGTEIMLLAKWGKPGWSGNY